ALQRVFFDRMRFDKDHKSYFPLSVVRLDTQGECHVPLSELRAGDIILIRNKELIPADGVLVKGTALIDYSFVTGEAIPIFKQENETLYAGGRQVGGAIEIKVRKEPSKSYLTQLWNQHNTSKENEEDYESIVNKRSKYFTYGVLAVAISALVYWTYMDGFAKGVLVMATTLNVSCPCALAVAIPFTYANVVSQLAQRGFFLKNPQVIERITQVDTLVFDKTGTLTEPEQSTITYEGSTLDEPLLSMLKAGLRQSTHPLSVQLYRFIDALRLPPVQCEEVIGKGLRITAEGAYDIEIRLGSHEYVSGTNNTCTDLKTSVYIGVNSEVKGRYLFQNKYQQGLDRMLHSFTASGYRVDLASGDNEAELAEIQQLLPNAHILFNQKPEDKLHLIQDLQHKDHIVMMVGDGLNDAIALHQSNVGVAVVHAHNQFSPSSDVILSAPAVKYMDAYVRYCTECMGIIKASFIFSSMYNVIGLSFAIQGLFSPVFAAILMPVSSISVVLFSVFLTNWRASKTFKHLNESI
ncbi:MAG TPA: HAD-IC family P-type ATPase, partial [Cytophagales bacterium]|nr:HAD-IC family P-type ATPase [Cytophagales bacterium]